MKNIRQNKKEEGFTLIELLIVISIIGVLVAIVLSDLSNAKIKAQDVVAKQNLTTVRTQAGIFYDSNNTYTDVCLFPKIAEALDKSSEVVKNPHNCDSSSIAWAAEIELSTSEFYCIDWDGNASTTATSKGELSTVCF